MRSILFLQKKVIKKSDRGGGLISHPPPLTLNRVINRKIKISIQLASIFIFISNTVGENIIATTKIRNNYSPIQSFKFQILRQLLEERKLYGKQYRKEAMNQSTKLTQKLKQRH